MNTTSNSSAALRTMAEYTGQPYLVVSTDAHAGPSPERHLRPYCPEKFLPDFDEYCRASRATAERSNAALRTALAAKGAVPTLGDFGREGVARCVDCDGHHDPHVRLRHMDDSGVAAEVVFAGGQNFEELPFMGKGWNAGPAGVRGELRTMAGWIWNRWIADYTSVSPHRLLGVLQTPVWDVDAAVREIEWGAEHGIRVVNLPAPRRDFPAYTDPVYDRLWSACAATGAVLVTHSAGGEEPLGIEGRRGRFLQIIENHWLGNRGLAQLIFGGVFHRHPNLKFVLTEQRVEFAPDLIRHLDSCYVAGLHTEHTGAGVHPAAPFLLEPADVDPDPDSPDALPRRPSEYWATNCFLSGSFLARYEVALRHAVGLTNLMWGSDYPHVEGTWPYTTHAIRHTFADVPEDESRLILGETAVGVYGLDRRVLAPIADRVGPSVALVKTPLTDTELALSHGGAFRQFGTYA